MKKLFNITPWWVKHSTQVLAIEKVKYNIVMYSTEHEKQSWEAMHWKGNFLGYYIRIEWRNQIKSSSCHIGRKMRSHESYVEWRIFGGTCTFCEISKYFYWFTFSHKSIHLVFCRFAFLVLLSTHSINCYAIFTLMKFQIYLPKIAWISWS